MTARVLLALTSCLTGLLVVLAATPAPASFVATSARCGDAVRVARDLTVEWLRWYSATARPNLEFGPTGAVVTRDAVDLHAAVHARVTTLAHCDVTTWIE